MAHTCTTRYFFRGRDSEIARLHQVFEFSDWDYISLEEICKKYINGSDIDYAYSNVGEVSDCNEDCSYFELEIISLQHEPEGVFEALFNALEIVDVEYGYYAVEPCTGYAKGFVTDIQLSAALPKYYYDFYLPGVDCLDGVADCLETVIKLFNESLPGLDGWEEVEGEPYSVVDYIVSDNKESTLLDNCYKLNKKFSTDESEWHATILKFEH